MKKMKTKEHDRLWDLTFECTQCEEIRYISVIAETKAEAIEKGQIEHPCHKYRFKKWGRE